MVHCRRRIGSPGILLAALFLALTALLMPGRAQATVTMSADAGATFGFADQPGVACSITKSTTPSIFPQSALFTCSDAVGDVQTGFATASFGSTGASALVIAQPCLSSDECAGNVGANASYTDNNITIFGPTIDGTTTIVTGNIAMAGSGSATRQSEADVIGSEFINGQLALTCVGVAPTDFGSDLRQGCVVLPVRVPVGVPLTVTLQLHAGAGANGGFSQTGPQQGLSNFADTFRFPIGSDVFNLEPGFTVDAPDSFIFNNVFSPPDETAVPEPASSLTFAVALAGLTVLHRRTSRVVAIPCNPNRRISRIGGTSCWHRSLHPSREA
jgi:hypothetical protein